jgi:hypothetical protein
VAEPNSSNQGTQVLGAFASILGLLGIFLYFTGWIYRWAYFGWFRIELNRLDLPLRSFLFVPIQVFFGDFWAFLRTIIAFVVVAIAIKLTLWLLDPLPNRTSQYRQKFHQVFTIPRYLAEVIPTALRNDAIAVVWLLIILFWLARIQGAIDARRDAVNETSTLPVITLVLPEKQIALGRNLDESVDKNGIKKFFIDPSLKGYRIIGDKGLFDDLRGKETNDSEIDPPRVWRLLLENNNWSYLFPALPVKSDADRRPPILAIKEDKEGQLMILAPDYTRSP